MNKHLYRPNVGIILLNNEKKIFIGRRYDSRHEPLEKASWQMPQGGIDAGETPREAALRELWEEVGTDKVEILKESDKWYQYDLPPHLQQKLWRGRYLGQRQKWFLMHFKGTDADINIETVRPEFCAMQWADVEQVIELIVPFKNVLYTEVLGDFKEYLI